MSQKLILVKYIMEDGIPVDETSENLGSAYLPDELHEAILHKGFYSEINIKETQGAEPEISVIALENLDEVINQLEAEIFELIKVAHIHTGGEVHIRTEIERDLRKLSDALKVREICKVKCDEYADRPDILVILG